MDSENGFDIVTDMDALKPETKRLRITELIIIKWVTFQA